MKLSFTKMQGCANDYIYLDCRASGVPENIAALSEKLSRRHFSIGADGIICICAAQTAGADGMMRIFNADGSEGKMCGNGIRCVAEWLYTHGIAKETLAIDTLSGLKTVTRPRSGQPGFGQEKTPDPFGSGVFCWFRWWRGGGSNSRPSHCERDALPAELPPQRRMQF